MAPAVSVGGSGGQGPGGLGGGGLGRRRSRRRDHVDVGGRRGRRRRRRPGQRRRHRRRDGLHLAQPVRPGMGHHLQDANVRRADLRLPRRRHGHDVQRHPEGSGLRRLGQLRRVPRRVTQCPNSHICNASHACAMATMQRRRLPERRRDRHRLRRLVPEEVPLQRTLRPELGLQGQLLLGRRLRRELHRRGHERRRDRRRLRRRHLPHLRRRTDVLGAEATAPATPAPAATARAAEPTSSSARSSRAAPGAAPTSSSSSTTRPPPTSSSTPAETIEIPRLDLRVVQREGLRLGHDHSVAPPLLARRLGLRGAAGRGLHPAPGHQGRGERRLAPLGLRRRCKSSSL